MAQAASRPRKMVVRDFMAPSDWAGGWVRWRVQNHGLLAAHSEDSEGQWRDKHIPADRMFRPRLDWLGLGLIKGVRRGGRRGGGGRGENDE